MNECRKLEDLFGPYVLDAAEPAEARQVEKHVAVCERCRDEVAQRRRALGALPRPAPLGEAARWRIIGAVQREVRVGERHRRPRRESLWPRALAGAAAAAGLFVLGLWIGGRLQTPTPTTGRVAVEPASPSAQAPRTRTRRHAPAPRPQVAVTPAPADQKPDTAAPPRPHRMSLASVGRGEKIEVPPAPPEKAQPAPQPAGPNDVQTLPPSTGGEP